MVALHHHQLTSEVQCFIYTDPRSEALWGN